MTRLPVDSWDVTARFDIPPYSLNTICPVTGEVSGLEDHHIFRRSFTALGQDNRDIYWIEYVDLEEPAKYTVKNRVALSPEAHQRITTNVARLEYRGTDLYYVEDGEEKLLNLDLHLMADGEKVSKRRRKPNASTTEERKKRKSVSIWTPDGEDQIIPELIDAVREKLAPEMGWKDDVPAHYVVVAALAAALQ